MKASLVKFKRFSLCVIFATFLLILIPVASYLILVKLTAKVDQSTGEAKNEYEKGRVIFILFY